MKAIKMYVLLLFIGVCSCKAPKDFVYVETRNFKMKDCGFDKTTLSMDLRLYNPNKFRCQIKDVDIDVYMNGNSLGKMNAAGKYPFPKLDTASLPVSLNISMKNILPNAFQLLTGGGEVTIKLKGAVKGGRHGLYITVPVDYEGKQDIMSCFK